MEAARIFKEIVNRNKKNFIATHFLGIVEINIGNEEAGLKLLKESLNIKPFNIQFVENYAVCLYKARKFRDAIEICDYAIHFQHASDEILHLKGLSNFELNLYSDSILFFDKILSRHPNNFVWRCERAVVLAEIGDFVQAESEFKKVLKINPLYAEGFCNYGKFLEKSNSWVAALASYEKAILVNENYAEAFNNRGGVLHELKRFDAALRSYDKAISIKSDYAEAFNNRGDTLHELKMFGEAIQSFDKAISIKSDYAEAFNNRARVFEELKCYDESLESYDRALSHKPNAFFIQSNRLFLFNFFDDMSATFRLEEAKKFGDSVARKVNRKFEFCRTGFSSKKLRLGFVSADFRIHPVGFFLDSVLSQLDQTKIDLIAYTNNYYEDEMTIRFKSFFGSYNSIVGKTDEEAANLIHDHRIDILIDLSGHTAFNRLPVFAYKPAPIQVSWLGYCGSTGVQEIDYILGDPYVTPQDEEPHFCEKIKRLPETYFCFSEPKDDVEVNSLPALINGYVTFGCFNNFSKVNETVIEVWAKILLSVNESRLLLKAGQFKNSDVISTAVSLFNALGVSSDRLSFEGPTNRGEYFKSYNKVDIALDPFPYPGGTTSLEALWMGVPVLTKKGNHFISHNGETIAHNSGQKDWIAQDDADYIDKAVRFSTDLQGLAKLRSGLRAQVLASPLFDAKRFAGNFENAMFDIWEEYNKENSSD